MKNALCVLLVLTAMIAGGPSEAAENEVDCSSLQGIAIGNPEGYDAVYCYSVGRSGLSSSSSERRMPVGGTTEMIVALNRATFAVVRHDGTNNRTYLRLHDVREALEGSLDAFEPRNWGRETRHDRFSLIELQAKITEGSPYLSCVGFLARLRPVAGGPGYREAIGGLYCAMDTLSPTEAEVRAFLDGLAF